MSRNKYPEQTREQILDTATRLFLQQGYEHTTIQNIIDQLGGLTKGAVYHHFSSKEAILNAVAARIFENNSLSATWQKIAASTTLTGSQKLTQMLLAAITDPQEAQFRKLGVQLRNSPQMLRDLLYRSVEEIAPTAFLPVVEAGIADGSLQVAEPTAFAEVVALLANLWLSPLVFADGPEAEAKAGISLYPLRTHRAGLSALATLFRSIINAHSPAALQRLFFEFIHTVGM